MVGDGYVTDLLGLDFFFKECGKVCGGMRGKGSGCGFVF